MLKKLLVGMLVLPVMLLGCAEGETFTSTLYIGVVARSIRVHRQAA